MPENDRQALLESIAFGRDRDVKPADRLRALELLHELGYMEPDGVESVIRRDLARLSASDLDAYFDDLYGEEVMGSVLVGQGRFPVMEAVLAAALGDD